MDHSERTDGQPEAARTGGERKPYSTPKLIEYGSVTQLTAGTRTRQSDAPAAGFKKT